MKILDAPSLRLRPSEANILSPSLTVLSTSVLPHPLAALPSGLTTLILQDVEISSKFLNHLPKSLTELSLSNPTRTQGSSSMDAQPLGPSASLPPRLTSLSLHDPSLDADSFVKTFNIRKAQSLLRLFSDSETISDHSILLLNRQLKSIDLSSSNHISGKCFPYLPRTVTFLNFSNTKSIYDWDIQHLPRALKTIKIRCAIHLSDDCIPDLPKHLEEADLSLNSKITTACIDHLPPLLKCGNQSFIVSRWCLKWGKIEKEGIF